MEHCTKEIDAEFIVKNTQEIQDGCLRSTHAMFSEICAGDKIMAMILHEYSISAYGKVSRVLSDEQAAALMEQTNSPPPVWLILFFVFFS